MRAAVAVCAIVCVLAAPRAAAAPDADGGIVREVRTIEGLTIHQWHWRAVRNRRVINRLNRDGARLRGSLRARVTFPSGLERAFLCIHRFEGSWTDPNAPYFGGLQMDGSFMAAYGGEFLRAWGPANNWPVSVQLAVAMRAYLSGRGFGPWPNTRRMCGL